ncbi:unnamed protein product [Euphydryas editha]|uniref:Uncharacterized protein n=1 Tax=Euphydryas editha TaxID=104508 RepID=A0AAU9U8T8_EUPED|nr:unnamed protein product [Euphydryas editha]
MERTENTLWCGVVWCGVWSGVWRYLRHAELERGLQAGERGRRRYEQLADVHARGAVRQCGVVWCGVVCGVVCGATCDTLSSSVACRPVSAGGGDMSSSRTCTRVARYDSVAGERGRRRYEQLADVHARGAVRQCGVVWCGVVCGVVCGATCDTLSSSVACRPVSAGGGDMSSSRTCTRVARYDSVVWCVWCGVVWCGVWSGVWRYLRHAELERGLQAGERGRRRYEQLADVHARGAVRQCGVVWCVEWCVWRYLRHAELERGLQAGERGRRRYEQLADVHARGAVRQCGVVWCGVVCGVVCGATCDTLSSSVACRPVSAGGGDMSSSRTCTRVARYDSVAGERGRRRYEQLADVHARGAVRQCGVVWCGVVCGVVCGATCDTLSSSVACRPVSAGGGDMSSSRTCTRVARYDSVAGERGRRRYEQLADVHARGAVRQCGVVWCGVVCGVVCGATCDTLSSSVACRPVSAGGGDMSSSRTCTRVARYDSVAGERGRRRYEQLADVHARGAVRQCGVVWCGVVCGVVCGATCDTLSSSVACRPVSAGGGDMSSSRTCTRVARYDSVVCVVWCGVWSGWRYLRHADERGLQAVWCGVVWCGVWSGVWRYLRHAELERGLQAGERGRRRYEQLADVHARGAVRQCGVVWCGVVCGVVCGATCDTLSSSVACRPVSAGGGDMSSSRTCTRVARYDSVVCVVWCGVWSGVWRYLRHAELERGLQAGERGRRRYEQLAHVHARGAVRQCGVVWCVEWWCGATCDTLSSSVACRPVSAGGGDMSSSRTCTRVARYDSVVWCGVVWCVGVVCGATCDTLSSSVACRPVSAGGGDMSSSRTCTRVARYDSVVWCGVVCVVVEWCVALPATR